MSPSHHVRIDAGTSLQGMPPHCTNASVPITAETAVPIPIATNNSPTSAGRSSVLRRPSQRRIKYAASVNSIVLPAVVTRSCGMQRKHQAEAVSDHEIPEHAADEPAQIAEIQHPRRKTDRQPCHLDLARVLHERAELPERPVPDADNDVPEN